MKESTAFFFVIVFLISSPLGNSVVSSFLFPRSMAAGSEVKENTLAFDCCKPKIQINLTCDNILSCNDKTFAYFTKTGKRWSSPCKVVEGNIMTLSECVNVTMKTWCTNKNGKSEEYVTNFFSQPCPPGQWGNSSLGYQASITLLLMPALMAAKFMLHGIC